MAAESDGSLISIEMMECREDQRGEREPQFSCNFVSSGDSSASSSQQVCDITPSSASIAEQSHVQEEPVDRKITQYSSKLKNAKS